MDQNDRWHEENIGTLARHDQIKFPQLIGDKLLYAYHQDEWYAALGDWRSRSWADILHLSMAEGQPLILGRGHDGRVRVQWYGITGNAYADIPYACVSNGHLYHPAKLPNGRWCVVVDHKETDDSYTKILGLSVHEGRIFLAVDDGQRQYVLDDGRRGQTWDAIWGHQLLNGRSLYAAKRERDTYVVHGDNAVGPWHGVWNLKTYRDKPLYSIMDGNRHEVYFGACNWRSPTFVQDIACVNDKPFFSVKVDGAWTVMYDNVREGGFRRISRLFNNHAKPLYEAVALEGRSLFFGREQVTNVCDEVLTARPALGNVVAICRVGESHQIRIGDKDQRTYAMAFGLRQKKHRFECGAIAGSDILLVKYNF